MKAFITGITGFAGSWLAEHLLACGDEVLGASRSAQWGGEVPDELRRRVRVVPCDIAEVGDDAALRATLAEFQPDVVYHLAALAVPDDCGDEWPSVRAGRVNVGGTLRVAELAAQLPARPRFLLASTSHVYAPVTAEQFIVDEHAPLEPQAGYGASKLAAEEAAMRVMRETGLPVVIARAFQHTGPRQESRLMLPSWARQFAAGVNPVQVHNLQTHLDLTDVRDVVRCYRLLATRGEPGVCYNVGSGRSTRNGELFEQLQQLADPARQVVELSPGKKQNCVADLTRLTAHTGWRPLIPLSQTVADTWRYWQQQSALPHQPASQPRTASPGRSTLGSSAEPQRNDS
ncbi:MAG: GDP-mannose 4,6-dehydratase [Planctomycetes bacterium]|nr:GDP-mannose 4,6-dehydratase [Planctomycetota bacterium]